MMYALEVKPTKSDMFKIGDDYITGRWVTMKSDFETKDEAEAFAQRLVDHSGYNPYHLRVIEVAYMSLMKGGDQMSAEDYLKRQLADKKTKLDRLESQHQVDIAIYNTKKELLMSDIDSIESHLDKVKRNS